MLHIDAGLRAGLARGIGGLRRGLTLAARRVLPLPTRRRLVRLTRWPHVGLVRFGSLRRMRPISSVWGTDRGSPVDRYYIEQFLAGCAQDIRGHVLEIGTDTYTRMFGGNRVTRSDVLHVSERNPKVTILGDLTQADHLPSDSFDCIILTQTLQFIYDVPAVLETVHRVLKPGGVALVTVPGIANISRYDMDRWGHYWSFTTLSARRLFEAVFPSQCVRIEAHGNVLASIAFLHGLAAEELRRKELDHFDPDYEFLITVRAEKPAGMQLSLDS
jgi:SAM-dependent methyltransferase